MSTRCQSPEAGVEVVLFDWGNTLMEDDNRPGPMAAWDDVAALPGARDMLAHLHRTYRLIVATNAVLSDATLVRAALARVGLDEFFDTVVTSYDTGAAKPEPAFFTAALRRAFPNGEPHPGKAVMVGDTWETDIAGAMAAGLRTVWLNRHGATRPTGSPTPDAEIRALPELIGALAELPAKQREPDGVRD